MMCEEIDAGSGIKHGGLFRNIIAKIEFRG